jgi:DNA-binding NarL/FixJ family response regulator
MVLGDVRLYRDGLVRALLEHSSVEIAGAARLDAAGLALLTSTRPDIVLVEAASARPSVIHSIRSAARESRVIAFAIGDDDNDAILCAEAGADGYVSREATVDDLVQTIVRVASGEFPCSPRIAALLARRVSLLAAQREPPGIGTRLTTREAEILRLIDAGLSNKEIAQRLGIGLSTVKNHVHNILHKTQASRRAQAAARARERI